MPSVGQELLNTPFPEMVQRLALAIAQAQTQLDENSTRVAAFMATTMVPLPQIQDPTQTTEFSLISLGFFPGYYQFQEAIIEVKMAITMATSSEFKIGVSAKAGWGPFSASVNASYSRKYEYKVEGSSLLRVKLAPTPPPAILQNYMDTLVDVQSKKLEEERTKAEVQPTVGPSIHLPPADVDTSGQESSGGMRRVGPQSGGRAPQGASGAPSRQGPPAPPSPPPGYDWPREVYGPYGWYPPPPPGWVPPPPPWAGGGQPPGKQGGQPPRGHPGDYEGGPYRPSE